MGLHTTAYATALGWMLELSSFWRNMQLCVWITLNIFFSYAVCESLVFIVLQTEHEIHFIGMSNYCLLVKSIAGVTLQQHRAHEKECPH
jgi:glycerol-3-phosphate acyltransferase PlsY